VLPGRLAPPLELAPERVEHPRALLAQAGRFGEVVEVIAHVVRQREQPAVRELNVLATDEAEAGVCRCFVLAEGNKG